MLRCTLKEESQLAGLVLSWYTITQVRHDGICALGKYLMAWLSEGIPDQFQCTMVYKIKNRCHGVMRQFGSGLDLRNMC